MQSQIPIPGGPAMLVTDQVSELSILTNCQQIQDVHPSTASLPISPLESAYTQRYHVSFQLQQDNDVYNSPPTPMKSLQYKLCL